MTGNDAIYEMATNNRLMIADVLESLDPAQWAHPTLSSGWTVRHMAAHFVQPMLIGFGRFFMAALRYRGDTDRTVDHFTRRLAARTPAELTTLLRERAVDRLDPPRVGPMGPFAETCVHLRDIARPLGLESDVHTDHWRILLDYLTSPAAAPALVAPGRLDGLRLVATDTEWTGGAGELLTGPAEALGMAATGRKVAVQDLDGPGRAVLETRLGA